VIPDEKFFSELLLNFRTALAERNNLWFMHPEHEAENLAEKNSDMTANVQYSN